MCTTFAFIYVCVCSILLSGANRGKKKGQDHLKLDSQLVVSRSLVAGNRTWPSVRAASALTHRDTSPAHFVLFLRKGLAL